MIKFISILILLSACKTQTNKIDKNKYALETFCDTFLLTHRNWYQNNIINRSADEDLKNDLIKDIPKGLFADFPLQLNLINEFSPGKYAAHFSTESYIKTKYKFNFDVIGFITKIQIEKLKTDSLYCLSGEFVNFLSDDYKNYSYGIAYSPGIMVKKDEVYEDSAAFDLGIILLDSLEIKRINTNDEN